MRKALREGSNKRGLATPFFQRSGLGSPGSRSGSEASTVALDPAVPLRDGLVIGRDEGSDIVLNDPAVSRSHLRIRRAASGWIAEDLGSKGGSFLNGRIFLTEELVYGDTLRVARHAFRFDGRRLSPALDDSGASLEAQHLVREAGSTRILNDVSFAVAPCEFVGIIGPSGAGKSTLLDALCGLRPAESGTVRIDGRDLATSYDAVRETFGYVPQDDIVPRELSVRDALAFAARLRLPRDIPPEERDKLVQRTIVRLGLEERAHTRVGRLSGGQRKRVSVAAELLGRPRILFLDEPTSGLDPAAEFRMMELLRELSSNGCTVLCTTHVMENVHLLDRLAIVVGGRLVYFDDPAKACATFGVSRFELLYDALAAKPAVDWPSPAPPEEPPELKNAPLANRPRRAWALPILLRREWKVFLSDARNVLFLLGQPALIGALVAWVSESADLTLFFAVVATLWFGCNNAAQEIVKETPMYRRERLIGLGRWDYLFSKAITQGRFTILQVLVLFGVLQLGEGGIGGATAWQMAALLLSAVAAVGIGLMISAFARTPMQAVMLVPLILIPQILFSGFVPSAGSMKAGPFAISRVMPSAAAQSVMDVSLLWGRRIDGATRVDFPAAFSNLNRDRSLRNGVTFWNADPATRGIVVLSLWSVGSLLVSWGALARRERDR